MRQVIPLIEARQCHRLYRWGLRANALFYERNVVAYRDKSQGHVFIHKKGQMITLNHKSDIVDDMAKELDVHSRPSEMNAMDDLSDILQGTEEDISEGNKSYKDMFLNLLDLLYSLITKHTD